jgi:MFS family permease
MTALLSLGVSVIYALVLGAAVVLVAVVLTATRLLQVSGAAPEALAFPRGIVLLLAALAAITFLAEGAVLDWGALLIVERDLASVQNAGMGYILFSVAMVAARLTGDRIVAALGEFYVLVFGGILAIAGVAVILLSPWPVVALTGFILIGLGAANIVPVVFSIAGRQTIMPAGLAIASVTTTGYAGILLGPTLIGFAAQQISLPNAFWILVVLLAIIPLTARAAVKA